MPASSYTPRPPLQPLLCALCGESFVPRRPRRVAPLCTERCRNAYRYERNRDYYVQQSVTWRAKNPDRVVDNNVKTLARMRLQRPASGISTPLNDVIAALKAGKTTREAAKAVGVPLRFVGCVAEAMRQIRRNMRLH